MNLIDEYYYWITKAITESIVSDTRYFYDTASNELFGLIFYNDNIIRPFYRNQMTSESLPIITSFNKKIKQVIAKEFQIVELPRLAIESRKNILLAVGSQMNNHIIEEIIALRLQHISDRAALNAEISNDYLERLNFDLRFQFSVEMTKHINLEIKRLYHPLGISTSSYVLW